MGRDDRGVFSEASTSSSEAVWPPGRSAAPLLRGAGVRARRDGDPAAGACRDEPRGVRGRPGARIKPDFVVGHSSVSSPPCGGRSDEVEEAVALVRERGLAMAEAARRTRARWPRSSVSTTRSWSGSAGASSTCGRRTTTAPDSIVVSGENPAVDEAVRGRRGSGARRAVSCACRVPSTATCRPGSGSPSASARERWGSSSRRAPFMSTVTARIESARRMAPLLVEQLTAPGALHPRGQALIKEGRAHLRRSRPGELSCRG